MKIPHVNVAVTRFMLCGLLWGSLWAAQPAAAAPPAKLNILFITADDMNHDSAGCYGCPIKDLTPNLDRLASEGLRFHYAYSTVAVCQPVREIMHTGLYPHRNGAMGFFPLKPEVRTLNQQLHDAGYLISMLGKNPHYQPAENFCVDYAETQISRQPAQLAAATKKFLARARAEKRPFFHHVNCTDPHRPFIGAGGPDDLAHGDPPSRWIKPEEVAAVPGFLEDLPLVRREVSQYYTNVRRLDDCVGAVLKALQEEGADESTLVVFYGGDHGMSFPFGKSNDYENSSRGALIIRWPGVIKPGGVDREHPRFHARLHAHTASGRGPAGHPRYRRSLVSAGVEGAENDRLGSRLHLLQSIRGSQLVVDALHPHQGPLLHLERLERRQDAISGREHGRTDVEGHACRRRDQSGHQSPHRLLSPPRAGRVLRHDRRSLRASQPHQRPFPAGGDRVDA